jgi:transaldolase
VKIPGTEAGLPAIRQALSEGVNINITLLFSMQQYVEVHEAYMAALEQRLDEGRRIDGISSVASFFVSRIDTLVDSWLQERAKSRPEAERDEFLSLRGKLGVANSRLVYERFRQMLDTDRWRRLESAGAAPQRVLWASTSTKDPDYPELLYVENLIGPDTVNTLPEATFNAFKDHGRVTRTVDTGYEQARAHMRALADAGIDVDAATRRLLSDGVEAFCKAHKGVVGLVEQRSKELVS